VRIDDHNATVGNEGNLQDDLPAPATFFLHAPFFMLRIGWKADSVIKITYVDGLPTETAPMEHFGAPNLVHHGQSAHSAVARRMRNPAIKPKHPPFRCFPAIFRSLILRLLR
jgi:hypothetical protein